MKPYLENYFNLSTNNTFINTAQITSNTGKAVKYYFKQNADYENAADLVIAYQDGSAISIGDIFTLNLIPDKNREVNPLLYPVSNVQRLGEALKYKIENFNIIADGEEHFSGKYYQNADGGRKPIYYRAWNKIFNTKNQVIGKRSEWKVDQFIDSGAGAVGQMCLGYMWNTYDNRASGFQGIRSYKPNQPYDDVEILIVRPQEGGVINPILYYIKTTDSWEY